MIPTYTQLHHPLRKLLNLTFCEYCVMDTIEHLSTGKYFCSKSKANIARDLGISTKSVSLSVKKLIQLGLVAKDPKNDRNLSATKKWFESKHEIETRFENYHNSNNTFFPKNKEKNTPEIGKKFQNIEKKIPESGKKLPIRIQENQIENLKNKNRINLNDLI